MLNNTFDKIQSKTDDFAYITFKMQALMYDIDKKFYGLESTVNRINTSVLVCANGNTKLLQSAKTGVINGFNRLKKEQDLPILSYDTISDILKYIDKKLQVGGL